MKNSLKITAIASTILFATALGAPAQASAATSVRSSITTSVNTTPVVYADPYANVGYSTMDYPTSYHWEAPSGYVVSTGQAVPTYNNYQHAPTQSAPDAASSGAGSSLASLARGQIGVAQDCTAMVEKALRSVGKNVGDLAPAQFYQYGSVVSTPAAGDLVITAGHVAIYVGGGKVVSGGLNGMNTGEHYLSDLPGASFVRVS